MWLLLSDNHMVAFILGFTLTGLAEALLRRSGSHISADLRLGIALGTSVCVVVPQYCVGAFTTRNQGWARLWAMGLVCDYGPGAPLTERYWWFGAVGTVLGLFCGLALLGLSVAVVVAILPLT